MSNLTPIDDLAQALNHREITDEDGQVIEENETPQEESPASEEQTSVEEDATAEKSADTEDESSQDKSEASENEPELVETASDETGKRYVPESRFKEVYGKMKELERSLREQPKPIPPKPMPVKPLDKADAVEIELLRATLPQFNPDSTEYSRELDELGYAYFKANPGLTRIEAARQALGAAKKLQSKVVKVEQEARAVKSQQSDQGITSRVSSKGAQSDVPPEDASDKELEEWLKAHGQW